MTVSVLGVDPARPTRSGASASASSSRRASSTRCTRCARRSRCSPVTTTRATVDETIAMVGLGDSRDARIGSLSADKAPGRCRARRDRRSRAAVLDDRRPASILRRAASVDDDRRPLRSGHHDLSHHALHGRGPAPRGPARHPARRQSWPPAPPLHLTSRAGGRVVVRFTPPGGDTESIGAAARGVEPRGIGERGCTPDAIRSRRCSPSHLAGRRRQHRRTRGPRRDATHLDDVFLELTSDPTAR